MSRTFTHKTDESTLTTLCPRCLNAFRNTRGIRVRRADPYQLTKEPCTYCQTNFGYPSDHPRTPQFRRRGLFCIRQHLDDGRRWRTPAFHHGNHGAGRKPQDFRACSCRAEDKSAERCALRQRQHHRL